MLPRRHIILISCVKSKRNAPAPAQDLYQGTWFREALTYARSYEPDAIFILSAKYGLLPVDRVVEPYEQTLNQMPIKVRKEWATKVLASLTKHCNLAEDFFTILAGATYREFLTPCLEHYDVPLTGLTQGRQLSFLTKANHTVRVIEHPTVDASACGQLHQVIHTLPRFTFAFDENDLPRNGIYFLFEKGEYGHGGDRIVRIGTHNGQNRLPKRLIEHFQTENKDRSIFRKNIGRALLTRQSDSFLEFWNACLTSRADRERYAHRVDPTKQDAVEKQVSAYMNKYFSFAVIPVHDRAVRLGLESRLIATAAQCDQCCPSQSWLGNHSPQKNVQQYGLWQTQHVRATPLDRIDDLIQSLASNPATVAEFTRVQRTPRHITIKVCEITWPHVHTPQSRWRVVRTLKPDATAATVERIRQALLFDSHYFGYCIYCHQFQPTGHMHSDDICQGCATEHMGVVY